MKRILVLITVLCIAGIANGQTKRAFRKAAEEAYNKKNYYAALTYYNEVLEFDANDKEALLRSAHAAREFNAYDIAVEKYTYLLDSLELEVDSTVLINTAEMFQRMGKYDKATEYYDRFITEYGSNDSLSMKAKEYKEKAAWASSRVKEVDEGITVERVNSDVNSNYSDFGAYKLGDSTFFTSMRFVQENPEEKPPRQLSRVMLKNGEESSMVLESPFNALDQPVGSSCINEAGNKIYYTVCDYRGESDLRCDIYSATIQKGGKISDERILPKSINDTSYTTTHPFITKDEKTGNEILYFASDRPGGNGGLDIWYSVYDKKIGYSKPINISSINTEGNEASPFYHKPSGMFYFSSDGYLGLGGYDIYQSRYNGGQFGTPAMLPAPTNSSYHELFYVLNESEDEAIFSTNREGASYIDNVLKACCFDVYTATIEQQEIDLLALTYDKFTNEELIGARVSLYDKETGELIETIKIDTSHIHPFKVKKNREFLVVGEYPGYLTDTIEVSTYDLETEDPIEEKLFLEPDGVILDALTFDAETKEALIGAKVILEDLSDPTADQIIKINVDDNFFRFKLDKDKSYKLYAEKNGYIAVSEIVDTRNLTGLIKRNLYLNPFDLGAYLPIVLYFDNDEPDPDSKSTATNAVYGDLLEGYMARKETFMNRYGEGAKGDAKQASIDRMEEFFEGDVRGGYDQFRVFMDGLINELKLGKRIDLTIRGYASPRFDVKYNLVLAQRRINSARNDMESYANGALMPFLKSKQLVITEISFGEELSPSDVSDNLFDEKESIYSLRASKQRRIEVVSVIGK